MPVYALPWWGWLLCGAGGLVLAAISIYLVDFIDNGARAILVWLVGVAAALGALVSFVIAIIRFVKWARR
ncbi:MAG TPA: hypothetical protein VK763_14420 [Terriglobales bacterium]|jgi:hypothetical protein|nr:hypothetical protein [Terriglobales bacterium]